MVQIRARRAALLAVLIVLAVTPGVSFRRLALAPGEPAPRLFGQHVDSGEPFTFDWSRHEVTLVNFWATWCAPCREELPVLQELWEERSSEGVGVVGVANEPKLELEKIRAFLEPLGIEYPNLRAHARLNEKWGGIGVLPTTFLVSREGVVLRRYVGGAPEQLEGILADIDAILAKRPLGKQKVPLETESATGPPRDEPDSR